MKSLSIYTYTLLLLHFSLFSYAQKVEKSIDYKNEIKLGIGFIGLLQLDEINGEKRFTREALIPVFFNYQRDILKRFSVGFYFGYEYEKISGTLIDFKGRTHSFVTGLFVDFHVFKHEKDLWIDPYIGLAYYNYSGNNELPLDYAPSLRVGFNFYPIQRIGVCINTGVGSSLIETGLAYKF